VKCTKAWGCRAFATRARRTAPTQTVATLRLPRRVGRVQTQLHAGRKQHQHRDAMGRRGFPAAARACLKQSQAQYKLRPPRREEALQTRDQTGTRCGG
jgi:hypothetical protein